MLALRSLHDWCRESGLLRPYRGVLKRTKKADRAIGDPVALWTALLPGLLPDEEFVRFVSMVWSLQMLEVFPGRPHRDGFEEVVQVVSDMGWRYPDGAALTERDVYPARVPAYWVLRTLGGVEEGDFHAGLDEGLNEKGVVIASKLLQWLCPRPMRHVGAP